MKKLLILLTLLVLVFVVSCEKAMEEVIEHQIESESGGDAEVDMDSGSMTIETDEGTVEIESSGLDSDEWCKAGAQWKFKSTTAEGAGNAQWMIEGLMTSGKFDGLCHVVYTATGPDGDARMDYYFSEDGESGYFEMDINGQKMTSEWSG